MEQLLQESDQQPAVGGQGQEEQQGRRRGQHDPELVPRDGLGLLHPAAGGCQADLLGAPAILSVSRSLWHLE